MTRYRIHKQIEQLERLIRSKPTMPLINLDVLNDDEKYTLETLSQKYPGNDLSLFTDDELRELLAIQKKLGLA